MTDQGLSDGAFWALLIFGGVSLLMTVLVFVILSRRKRHDP